MSRLRMVLETKRLLLREMKPDDFQALFRVPGAPETTWHDPCAFDERRVPFIKTEESIGMHFASEYPDETNETTHISAISRKNG